MKKMIFLAATALIATASFAQNKGLKGTWFATSQFGYQQTKSGSTKSTNLMVLPVVGNFVSPSVALGLGAGYTNIKAKDGSSTEGNANLTVIQPLVRKYWNVSGGLYFIGQLAAPIITGKEKESNLKISQYGLSMSGGFDYVITKHFTAEFSYNLINVSTTTLKPAVGEKTTITDISVAHVANVDPFYNTALGGSVSGITSPLSFGFKFLF